MAKRGAVPPPRQPALLLKSESAMNSIYRAWELHQCAITHEFNNASAVPFHRRDKNLTPQFLELL